MLSKERKWNHLKCSVKNAKCKERMEGKYRDKNKGQQWKTVTNIVILIQLYYFECNGVNVAIKRQRLPK